MAISGQTLVAGALNEVGTPDGSGAAYVFGTATQDCPQPFAPACGTAILGQIAFVSRSGVAGVFLDASPRTRAREA